MDNTVLDVIIGLVFIYLLFSILLTSLSELIFNTLFGLRGNNLEFAVKSAFGAAKPGDKSTDQQTKAFFEHGLIASLIQNDRKPSELPNDLFAKAYLGVLGDFTGPTTRPATPGEFLNQLKLRSESNLPNKNKIVASLDPLLAGAETSWEAFERNVANWFADIGERSRGWYKRKVDRRMLVLAGVLVVAANVDTFFIIRMLELDKQHRDLLRDQATQTVSQAEGQAPVKLETPRSQATQRMQLRTLFDAQMVDALVSLRDSILDSETLRTALYKRCPNGESKAEKKAKSESKASSPDVASNAKTKTKSELSSERQASSCNFDPYLWYDTLEAVRKDVWYELSPQTNKSPGKDNLRHQAMKLFELSSSIYFAYPDPARKEDIEIQKKIRALRPAVDKAAGLLQQQLDSMNGDVLAADVRIVCQIPANAAGKAAADDKKEAEANEKKAAKTNEEKEAEAKGKADEESQQRCKELYALAVAGKLGFPIGWSKPLRDFQDLSGGRVEWISGLFLTWLALLLGAPFWFDILRRVVAMRTAGTRQDTAASDGSDVAGGGGVRSAPPPPNGPSPAGASWFADALNDSERRLSPDLIRQIQQRLEVAQTTGRLDQATRDAIYQWRQRRRPDDDPSWELDQSMIRELLWLPSDPLALDQAALPALTVLPASDGPMEDLRVGSRGPEVLRLRGLLAAKDYLEATGSGGEEFDDALDKAVKEFQAANALSLDGSVGPVTWLKLSNDPAQLPAAYSQPLWMARAIHELGITEISASADDNPRIHEYQDSFGATADDEIPWCSSFVNWVILQSGLQPTRSAVASSWRGWGVEIRARYGAVIVIIARGKKDPGTGGSGAHVGFLVRETSDCYLILGGNQGGSKGPGSVCVTRFPKASWNLLAMRDPGINTASASATGTVDAETAAAVEDIDIEPARRQVHSLTEPRLEFGSGNTTAVALLQSLLGGDLTADGVFGKKTREALLKFQLDNHLPETGVADAASWALLREGPQAAKASADFQPPLTIDAIRTMITDLVPRIELAAVQAVIKVESAGRGFAGGQPLVRLEGHKLWEFTKQLGTDPSAWASTKDGAGILHPDLSSRFNQRGAKEWARFEEARELCEKMFAGKTLPANNKLGVIRANQIADVATSWGLFQIMGFNWAMCGCDTLDHFIGRMKDSEDEQLALFLAYLTSRTGALDALANQQWARFARLYNGPRFRENAYDTKLERAYAEARQRLSG